MATTSENPLKIAESQNLSVFLHGRLTLPEL
jgi:hypothetical protein